LSPCPVTFHAAIKGWIWALRDMAHILMSTCHSNWDVS